MVTLLGHLSPLVLRLTPNPHWTPDANPSKWNLLLRIGVFTLDASNIQRNLPGRLCARVQCALGMNEGAVERRIRVAMRRGGDSTHDDDSGKATHSGCSAFSRTA